MQPVTAESPGRPFRDRLPTLPFDLSDYAREQTGPSSWSATPAAEAGAASAERISSWALEPHDDLTCARTTRLLVAISPLDVPTILLSSEEASRLVTHREAFVLAMIDGKSTLEEIVDATDLPPGEVLDAVCRLAVRGLVALAR